MSNRTKRGEKLPISNNTTLTNDRSIDICFQKEELYSLGVKYFKFKVHLIIEFRV